jgi:predicted transcriptional regulator
MRPNKKKELLTEVELELMNILWQLGEGTVRDVLAHLANDRHLAYTSVSTIIRILEQNNFVSIRKQVKIHIYTPVVPKEVYEARSLNHIVKNLFNNAPTSLVARLVDDQNLSQQELKEMKKTLEEKLKK